MTFVFESYKPSYEVIEEVSEEEVYSINLAASVEEIPYNEIISNQVINYAKQFVGVLPYVC